MIVGYERPITSGTLRPSREACESCHWPSMEHHDSVAVKVHYGTDAESSESRTRIVLHTGMDVIRQGYTKGIHWHIQNEVRFVSPDPQRRESPWVEVRKPDGTKVTYTDAETKLTAQQIAALEPRAMACYDCHNSVGHPFPNPASTVDEAIRTGKIDRALPDAKARAVALVNTLADITGDPKDREAKVDKLIADATAKAKLTKIRFHDLRHSHATLLFAADVHPKIVSERLGHSNISITLQTYSHVATGLQESAAQTLEDAFLK